MSWKYIAGFVDGEGYLIVREYDNRKYKSKSHGDRGEIYFSQSQKQDKVMYIISDFLTEKGIQHNLYRVSNKKCPVTIIRIGHKKHIALFLIKCIRHMVVKRKAAENLYSFCKGKNYESLPIPRDQR